MTDRLLERAEKLAAYFPVPLYMVGGAVRNGLLSLPCSDVDLSCAMPYEEVLALLKDSPFSVSETNKKLFTLKIEDGEYAFEYTSFRKDSYPSGGVHTPCLSTYTKSLYEDALRRDFTVNAIYYDIKAKKTIDPLGGEADVKKRILRTVTDPETVFSQDGLRLMRLARFACELNFSVDEATLLGAKKHAKLILDIAPERIRVELQKIMTADLTYGITGAHVRGLRLLDEIGVLEYILPELSATKGVTQRSDFHKYDVFEHLLHTVELAPPSIRFAALFHDAAKPLSISPSGSMRGHDEAGARLTKQVMTRLCFSKAEISRAVRLVREHMYDYRLTATEDEAKLFIVKNCDIIEDVIALRTADHNGKGFGFSISPSAQYLAELFDRMKKDGTPFSLKDLELKGDILDEAEIPIKFRSELMQRLLEKAILFPEYRCLKKQREFIYENKNQYN